jgi:hypothetical protein
MFAQESTVKGSITGVVVDSSGAVVPKAKLTLTGPTGAQTAESAGDGAFTFPLLTPGSYGVKVEKQGFKSDEVKAVEVATGRTTSLRLQLQVGAVSETVEVTATAVTIDTTGIATGSNLNDAFYASVPVPRNVSGLFYIAPGVADSGGAGRSNPSISGGSGLENLYVADGVNITDAAFGGLGIFTRMYGSVGSGINLTFVKDVNVKTGSFGAEYGQSTGGVVQIVTKSGGQEFHGALGAYFAPVNAAAAPKQIDAFRNRKVGQDAVSANGPGSGLFAGPGGYDASGELGGFIPGFKKNLFFFGSYSPALKTDFSSPPQFAGSQQFFASQGFTGTPPQVGLFTLRAGKPIYTRAWTNNYAAKLTWKLSSSQSLESSVFGDPTSTNTSAFRVVNAQNTSVFSKQDYSTRNWVVRYNGTLSPTWLVNANFSWNNNQFTENPLAPNVFNIVDRTVSGLSPTLQGLGFVENHNADNFSYAFDTSKSFHFLGTHTVMVGGTEGFLNYDDIKSRTGGRFAVPDLGDPLRNTSVYGCPTATGNTLCPLGFTSNATFTLRKAPSTCTLCPFYTTVTGQTVRVLARTSRGEYGPPVVSTDGLALAGFAQDTWSINKHLTFNAGLRWEQYRMRGVAEHYTFTDNWAPRLGVVYDPWGDRKTKVFLNWARYNYQMPLDAAIRSLSDELDMTGLNFAPASSGGAVTINSNGSINIIPDAGHLLNKLAGGNGGAATISEQAGGNLEGFAPGTKMQYEDEYVVGIERELGHQMVVSARYLDRRLRRIVEDMGGVSPEAADFGFPFNQIFVIGNPHAGLDLFKNEPIPTVQPFGAVCPSGNVSAFDANNFPFATGLQACWGDLSQQIADCSTTPPAKNCPGSTNPDGVSDGFANPVRNYQAVEFELNKGFSNNWLMRLNYRLAYLRGNYEGAFRNDNGQTDPSISSLFDFTTGVLNLLGDQFAVGPLNTDRHHTGNLFLSYTFDHSRFKGVTLGTGMRIQSGTPVSEFGNHPAYGNAGEVPIGGRGKEGRTPPTGAVDLHAEYAHKLSERVTMRADADLFNIFDSRQLTFRDQLRDLSFQAPFSNTKTDITGAPGANDFLSPVGFQNPFYARFAIKLQF